MDEFGYILLQTAQQVHQNTRSTLYKHHESLIDILHQHNPHTEKLPLAHIHNL